MGWSWAAACSVQGRGHIARLPAQLVVVGDDSLESASRDEQTLCMDMVYYALDWYKKAVIETREIEVRLKCILYSFCLMTVIVDAVVISSPM